MKVFELFCIVCISALLIGNSDAAITEWTEPAEANVDVTTTYTKAESETTIATLACNAGTPAYAIIAQPASARLQIGAATGLLETATGKKLDFETEPTYVLKVTCTDTDDDAVGTATITVSVTDANDAPEFPQQQYSLTVPDGTTEGYTLMTVSATDQDGDTVTFDLVAGNDDGHWVLDGTKIKVATSVTLDQTAVGGYSLEVEADDTTAQTTATVWVAVKTCSSVTVTVAGGLAMVVTVALSFLL